MAQAGVQEPSLPCKTLAGGETLLGSQEGSGWQPAIKEEPGECPSADAPTLSCPDDDEDDEDHGKVGDCPQPGHPGQGREWKELGRKKHRRRPSKKKRSWKPYSKLTWEEKQRLEERQAVRASRMRAEMFAKGQPVAPYNTTQFLMDDHNLEEPDLCPPPRRGPAALPPLHANSFSKGTDSTEEEDGTGSDGMGSDDGAEFLQKDFSETYERYHAESLQDMSKQQLVREYLELEKCLSRMEDDNNRLRAQAQPPHMDSRVRELETELEALRTENQRLLRERAEATGPAGQ